MPRSRLTGTQKKAQKYGAKHLVKREKQAYQLSKELAEGKHGPTIELSKLLQDFQRAGKGAEKIFAPIKEQALSEFNQVTAPEIFGQFGRQAGAGSSALNQALAAARGNLSRQLASDFAGLQANLAGNLLQQRESNKLSQLNSYLQQSGLSGGLQQGAFSDPYLQRQGGKPPSLLSTLLGSGLQAAGTIGGAILGGPPGTIAGGAAASGLNKVILPGMNQL